MLEKVEITPEISILSLRSTWRAFGAMRLKDTRAKRVYRVKSCSRFAYFHSARRFGHVARWGLRIHAQSACIALKVVHDLPTFIALDVYGVWGGYAWKIENNFWDLQTLSHLKLSLICLLSLRSTCMACGVVMLGKEKKLPRFANFHCARRGGRVARLGLRPCTREARVVPARLSPNTILFHWCYQWRVHTGRRKVAYMRVCVHSLRLRLTPEVLQNSERKCSFYSLLSLECPQHSSLHIAPREGEAESRCS